MKSIRITAFLIIALLSIPALANKSTVELKIPESATKDSIVKIIIKIKHNVNISFHFTERVAVKANGKEIAKWNYNKNNLPEKNEFIKEIEYKITGPAVIEAEANCNIHGSSGKKTASIIIK